MPALLISKSIDLPSNVSASCASACASVRPCGLGGCCVNRSADLAASNNAPTSAYFAPFAERRAAIVADKDYVERVLAEGAAKACAVARKTLDRVRQAVGLGA